MIKQITICLLIFSFSIAAAQGNGEKEISIKVFTPKIAWVDSKIESKMTRIFSTHTNLKISMVNNDIDSKPEFPQNYFNTENLVEWGKEVGSRFVMIVDVQSERIEKRKTFHIPLIFHKYQTYGVIEGEMRLFDIDRNKLLIVHQFKVEEKGSRIFQATMDDDINDPDLHISAPEKIRFFSKLEDKTVQELKKKTKVYLGLR